MESRISEVEKELTLLKTALAVHEAGIEKQKEHLLDHINLEFTTSKLAMNEIVESAKVEFAAQRMNLQTLYEATVKELEAMKERLEDVENKGCQQSKGRFLSAKHMLPRTLEKQEDWKQWKSEVEDYCEVVMEGTKEVLEELRNKRNTIEETDVKTSWWKT